jgi:transposase
MKQNHKYVGLDVHKERNEVALADSSGEVRLYGSISNDLHALEKLVVKLRAPDVVLHFVYEAGPCGFVIQRRLQQLDEDCIVVAPSLIPKKSGDRVKTDRRDATKLARLHRAGELTAIHIPDPRDEAIRDLIRARTDAVTDRRDNRHRLKAFLLRHGYKYTGKSSWTPAHLRYLRELVLADPAHKVVLEEYLMAITQTTERIERLETHIATLAASWRMKPVVDALQGLRGVQLLTAVALAAELGDLSRFPHPRQLMAFLGLVPSEYSSGGTRRQGSITKAGNSHARWFLVEAAQHYRLPPKVSKELAPRQEKLPARLREISWKAQVRLHNKYWAMTRRGKRVQTIQVAVARELVGFVWATARHVLPTLPDPVKP